MKTCKSCGKSYRTGRVAVILSDGVWKSSVVCQSCEKDGVLLVAAKPPVPKAPKGFVATAVLKDLRAKMRLMEKMAVAASNPADVAFVKGAISGLQAAVQVIEGAGP